MTASLTVVTPSSPVSKEVIFARAPVVGELRHLPTGCRGRPTVPFSTTLQSRELVGPVAGGARLPGPILASSPALMLVMKAMLLVEFFSRMRVSPVSRLVWKSLGFMLASSPRGARGVLGRRAREGWQLEDHLALRTDRLAPV